MTNGFCKFSSELFLTTIALLSYISFLHRLIYKRIKCNSNRNSPKVDISWHERNVSRNCYSKSYTWHEIYVYRRIREIGNIVIALLLIYKLFFPIKIIVALKYEHIMQIQFLRRSINQTYSVSRERDSCQRTVRVEYSQILFIASFGGNLKLQTKAIIREKR